MTGSLALIHGRDRGLPRGRSSLPRTVVLAAQEQRLRRAMISASAEKGYSSVTITELVGRARVSPNVFYQHFADKEACFLAAAGEGCELMFARIEDATADLPRDAPAADRLRLSLRAYLAFLSDEPEFARVFLIDALAAGPRALEGFVAAQRRFASATSAWHRRARREGAPWSELPAEAFQAIVGSLHELVVSHVREGRTEELSALEDPMLEIHLAICSGWRARTE